MQKLGIKDHGSTRAGDAQQAPQERKRELKTDDYGFSLGEDDTKKRTEEDKE
jgi:hypothetical protein